MVIALKFDIICSCWILKIRHAGINPTLEENQCDHDLVNEWHVQYQYQDDARILRPLAATIANLCWDPGIPPQWTPSPRPRAYSMGRSVRHEIPGLGPDWGDGEDRCRKILEAISSANGRPGPDMPVFR